MRRICGAAAEAVEREIRGISRRGNGFEGVWYSTVDEVDFGSMSAKK